jgi:NSS family neurotransmitter:Na+ symporter
MVKTIDSSSEQRFKSRLGLVLSALGIAVGTGNILRFPRIAAMILKQGANDIRTEINSGGEDAKLGKWWIYIIRWFIPVAAGILLIWWLAQSFVPGEWFNPFTQFSFMTCIFQWSIVLLLLILFNRKITKLFI